MNELAQRPIYYGQKGKALIHFWRACECYKMASRKNPNPTQEELDQATNLYKRIIRYALGDAHQWERANTYERYANSEQCKKDEARFDKRRAKLNEELKAYGLTLCNYGLYPSIISIEEKRREISLYYLD